MKVYNSKYRPVKDVEPSGGGLVSFMSWGRLVRDYLNKESIDGKVVDKIVVEDSGMSIYWKGEDE